MSTNSVMARSPFNENLVLKKKIKKINMMITITITIMIITVEHGKWAIRVKTSVGQIHLERKSVTPIARV